MKKTNLSISFETEKLDALEFYISKKEVKLQDELNETIAKLYEKHVPQTTREYIDSKLVRENKPPKTKKKPVKDTESTSEKKGENDEV